MATPRQAWGNPASADPAHWTSEGMRLHSMGRYEDALACADRVVALAPSAAVAWLNRALTLEAMRRPGEALASFDRALACDPNEITAWCGRAKALDELGRLDEALDASARAAAIAPGWAGAWAQRACTLARVCRDQEAIACLDHALALAPADHAARVNRGLVRLRQGDLDGGWRDYESRADALRMEARPPLPVPVWRRGAPLDGRAIALFAEQGAGDTIQFCRFAPLLAQARAQVRLVVPRPLVELLATVSAEVQVHAQGEPLPAVDLQCLLTSLPHRLGTALATIPATIPYLHPRAERLARWRAMLDAKAPATRPPRVGLACSGSAGNVNDARRSIALERLAPLVTRTAAAGWEWHLAHNDLRPADEPWLARLGIGDHRAALADFADAAALLACMDAVVSVDTSVAHLAGAIGAPLHLLLPASADWRWLAGREDSPWYPTARLYRQERIDDWHAPLARVTQALLAMAPGAPASPLRAPLSLPGGRAWRLPRPLSLTGEGEL